MLPACDYIPPIGCVLTAESHRIITGPVDCTSHTHQRNERDGSPPLATQGGVLEPRNRVINEFIAESSGQVATLLVISLAPRALSFRELLQLDIGHLAHSVC